MLSTGDFLLMTHEFKRFYDQELYRTAAAYSISKVEADVLLFLHNNPDYNTARDIVEYRYIAKSYVSKAVELLIQKGYIAAMEDSVDRRVIRLCILPASDEIICAVREAQNYILDTIRKGITEKEEDQMKQILMKVSANIRSASQLRSHCQSGMPISTDP